MTPIWLTSILPSLFILFASMKLLSSKSLISMLISMEMMMIGVFLFMVSKWGVMVNIHSVVGFLVIVVIEGVVGLLISTSLFRSGGVKSNSVLMF